MISLICSCVISIVISSLQPLPHPFFLITAADLANLLCASVFSGRTTLVSFLRIRNARRAHPEFRQTTTTGRFDARIARLYRLACISHVLSTVHANTNNEEKAKRRKKCCHSYPEPETG
jgi:hypothetical protein